MRCELRQRCDAMRQRCDGDPLTQVKFRSRNCPQYFGTGPIDQGGTRHGGSAAWISRTSVFVWPDLGKLATIHLVIGLGTSRRRRVIQGHDTSSRCRLQVQGPDTSRRCRLTRVRHITSLPPTRVQCPLCGYPSASCTLADSIRCTSSVGEVFFPHRFTVFVTRTI